MAIYLTEDDVRTLLPMGKAIEVVKDVLRKHAEGNAPNRPRYRLRTASGILHLMPGAVPSMGVMGYKSYATAKGNPAAPVLRVMLHNYESGELLAVVEAYYLTQVRTGAASAVATEYLAKKNSSSMGLIGAGFQGEAQVLGIMAVTDLQTLKVYDISVERRDHLCEQIQKIKAMDIIGVRSPEEAARRMDIITTSTSSPTPILLGKYLTEGTHINAVGSNAMNRREIDNDVVSKSDVIVVDDLETAKIECGDLLEPFETGMIQWEQVLQLGEIVTGRKRGRSSAKDITLFESQGIAVEDIAAAAVVYRIALEKGIGQKLPF